MGEGVIARAPRPTLEDQLGVCRESTDKQSEAPGLAPSISAMRSAKCTRSRSMAGPVTITTRSATKIASKATIPLCHVDGQHEVHVVHRAHGLDHVCHDIVCSADRTAQKQSIAGYRYDTAYL